MPDHFGTLCIEGIWVFPLAFQKKNVNRLSRCFEHLIILSDQKDILFQNRSLKSSVAATIQKHLCSETIYKIAGGQAAAF